MMIKNIGKLKQWTGERFGSAKTTLQTEDFQRLEVETERKRVAYEKLHAAAGLMQIQLAKKKPSPEDNNKSKRLPNDILGVCLTNYGSEFTDDTAPLGVALNNFGHAQSKLGHYQEEYAERMKLEYLEKLEDGLNMFKEYSNLRKKLESRRLDYDSKLGRLQKSKKEKPELEQELQASKLKYEDSEYDVIQKMAALQEFEDEHCDALQQFLEVQFEYFSRSLDILNEVRSNWGQPLPAAARQTSNHRLNNLSRTSSNNSSTINEEVMTRSPRLPLSRKGSTVDIITPPISVTNSGGRRLPTQRSLSFSDREESNQLRAPPILPRRQSQTSTTSSTITQRKAVYDFSGDNVDELSFRTGEIITVVEEVDEGWWLGEIGDRRGIFPVNYTELVLSHSSAAGPPSMPSRPSLSATTSAAGYRIAEHPDEYSIEEPTRYQEQQEPSPFGDNNRTTVNGRTYSGNNLRTNQPTRTLSSNTASSPMGSPMGSPIPRQQNTNNVAKRAPPPPPPSSRSVNQSRPTNARTAPSTPQIHHQQADSYFESTPACGDCGCNDFVANIFKKGHCNNCFHKH